MTVAMKAKYPGLGEGDVSSLENKLGHGLSDEYKEFLMAGNVMIPRPNSVQGQGMSGSVSKFLGVSSNVDDDLLATRRTYADRLPDGVIPIALAGGGNLVCVYSKNGQMYLWDHEDEAGEGEVVGFDNMHFIAKSFSEFLKVLAPFDSKDAVLNPDDVISVKLKPGFAEKFKDYR